MSTINCSVGILTFNSEKNLRRALESVKDFADIVISDGGSTDSTLEIAKEYGCRVIEQYAKNHPGPEEFHPIEDFARERNRLLEAAEKDWFLYIDSDEYISETLKQEIESIANSVTADYFVYEIPIGNQSPDAKITYRRWKQTYQTRFFNKKTGGRFKKVMHERYVFDREKFPTKKLTGKWFVPYSKPDFKSYSKAVNYRIMVMMREKPPKNFIEYLYQGIFLPLKRFTGFSYRMIMMRLKYPWSEVTPISYYINQCYSQWVTFKVVSKLYYRSSE